MKKNTKITIFLLTILIGFIGFMMDRNKGKEFTGGIISSHWLNENNNNPYGVIIDLESGFSREEIEYLGDITVKGREKELDLINAKKLGNPNNYMTIYTLDKSTGLAGEQLNFNLWLYEDTGYIQFIKDEDINNTRLENLNGISKLENEEYKFLTKTLLKYNSSNDILKK